MRPRIDPDYKRQDGHHLDEYWPGRVHSTWVYGPLTILRVRRYHEAENNNLRDTSWQFKCWRFAWRYDVDQ